MFERLTKKVFICGVPYFIDTVGNDIEAENMATYQIGMALNRLAAYEDSGLSPEQVQELVKVKADGRLVVQGEWLPHTNVTVKCSVCGGAYSYYNHCPNCGAKMAREAAEKAIAEVGE